MNAIFLPFVFVLGTVVGSFLNVCICRLPKEESIVFPASHCPGCKHPLAIKDLVPIISYIFLRGKCRYCNGAISPRYPLVEIITAVLYVAVFLKFGAVIDLFFYFVFIAVLIGITFADIETQTIHDLFPLTAAVAGVLFAAYSRQIPGSILGAIIGAGFLLFIKVLGKMIYKKEAMGEGDVLLAGAIGAFLGVQSVVVAIALSFVIGALFSIAFMLLKSKNKGDAIAFGPYLAFGAIIAVFFGQEIWRWYLGTF